MKFQYLLILAFLCLIGCKDEDYSPQISNVVYQEIKDTSYGVGARNKMDIYLPANRNEHTKTIIAIHGGAWISGDKSELNYIIKNIRALDPNIAIVNINYSLVDGKSVFLQDQINDVVKAVNFVQDNTSKFLISNKFAIVGASSGAHLAMLYAYKYNDSKSVKVVGNYFGPTRLDSKEWYDSFNLGLFISVEDLLFPLFGKPWDLSLYSGYSPYSIVNSINGKPTVSFHGALDPIVPKDHSKDLNAKLKQLSIPTEYYEYPYSLHELSDNDLKDSYPKLLSFINKNW
ncbi:alpha/beta hydrolase [Sphingobacterium bovistauri]|uniref:Alpha/beta hydrolase n=1 Tax=Sphingobacterium bovistauri TaxID=2781959 RepID=A0ABS7Z8C8_9SPHI|nr:alpha/beta hydrolase [Sphingobacterium bovistauri]MCA5006448.1 alpha/beta hydrolase [Sphingobacterium bovistauri]